MVHATMFLFPVPPVPEISGDVPPYLAAHDAFSTSELDRIGEIAASMPARATPVGDDNVIDPRYNRSRFRLLNPVSESIWIFEKLGYTAAMVNSRSYRFDLSGFDQPLYHITYPGEDQGFYEWHADTGGRDGATRKLSITVQLSEPSDYDGGELELNSRGEVVTAPKRRGAVVLFPSYTLHRVAPVTRGARVALVCWIVGPPFR